MECEACAVDAERGAQPPTHIAPDAEHETT
jgi:hypothetical protein